MSMKNRAPRRHLLNCLIVAALLWVATLKYKTYLFTRRSLHFRGLIPHAGVASSQRYRRLVVVEYVPPKSRLWSRDNFLLLFRGRYRVWEFRAVRSRTVGTLNEAKQLLSGVQEARNTPCKP